MPKRIQKRPKRGPKGAIIAERGRKLQQTQKEPKHAQTKAKGTPKERNDNRLKRQGPKTHKQKQKKRIKGTKSIGNGRMGQQT